MPSLPSGTATSLPPRTILTDAEIDVILDARAMTLLKSPRVIHTSSLLFSSSRGGRSICSSSSTWSSASTNASVESGEAQAVEQVWEEYFADPMQWWDKRAAKTNPESADFEHKVAKKSLWVDGRSTPDWVKAMLKLVTPSRLPSHVNYHTGYSEEIIQQNRLPEGNFGRRNTLPSSARDSKQAVEVGGVNIHMRGANTIREAIDVLKNRLRQGIAIDSYTYSGVLKRCFKPEALAAVQQVHDCILESGMQHNIFVATNLVSAYIRCGRLEDANVVFDELATKDVICWNVMIGGYAQLGRANDAMKLFNQMRQIGVRPDAVTHMSILKAFASPAALKWGEEVHASIRGGGFESDVRVGTALLKMYAMCGSLNGARKTFDNLGSRNIISWNVMIGAYADRGCGEEAYQLLLQMKREGFIPDAITYLSVLNACASGGSLKLVENVHSHAIEAGLETSLRVGSALVRMYAKNGDVENARLVFDRLKERDIVTWTVMIGGLAELGRGREAYEMFIRMQVAGFRPDPVTYVSILNACSNAGGLELVKEIHRHASEAGFELDLPLWNALIHMYAKCGSIDDARQAFESMEERNLISWNVMIGGLAQHGCGPEAVQVFRNMIATGVRPDRYSFVAVLWACSHAGLVDEGRQLFQSMSQDYGIVPSLVHWTCMADILGRVGHLEEAKRLIDSMPFEPDGSTWGAFLSACRSHRNVELGELAASEWFKLEPTNASPYVLLSNIYAAAEKWEKVSLVRSMMEERGIRKDAGRSWIEVDNKIHSFIVGDKSHPETKEIYAALSRLTEEIKAEGYIPDTRLVLHDVDDTDKESSLCSHSERLAIAYGLMCSQTSQPIRVHKNLRVCPDCHTAIKLISKVCAREIMVRDARRFHHFKDGVCSCKDYW